MPGQVRRDGERQFGIDPGVREGHHPDGFAHLAGGDGAVALDPHRRVDDVVSERSRHRDEPRPPAIGGRVDEPPADRCRLDTVNLEHCLRQHPDIGVQHAVRPLGADLASMVAQRHGGRA